MRDTNQYFVEGHCFYCGAELLVQESSGRKVWRDGGCSFDVCDHSLEERDDIFSRYAQDMDSYSLIEDR